MLKNIPDWLYEPLPYLYVLMGLIATIVLESLIGKISGVLLISAGLVIWNLRFTYRRRKRRPQPVTSVGARTSVCIHPRAWMKYTSK
jgi:hypothetical protein